MLLLALAVYSLLGKVAGSLFTVLAIVFWLVVLLVLAFEMGWLGFLSGAPPIAAFFSYIANRKAVTGTKTGEPDGAPRLLSEEERDKLFASAEATLDGLIGIDAARDAIDQKLIDIAQANPENPFGTQAPAALALFAGPRGTGKTTAAQAASEMLTGTHALKTAKIVLLRRTDLRSGDYSSPTELGRSKAEAAVDGTLLIDDADWLLQPDPYGDGDGPGPELGLAVLDVAQRYPRRIFLAATLGAQAAARLQSDAAHSRWLGKLTVRTVPFDHLEDDDLLTILTARLEDMGWHFADDAASTAARRLLSEIRDRRADEFDNAEACRRTAEKLVEAAINGHGEDGERRIDRAAVKTVDENLE